MCCWEEGVIYKVYYLVKKQMNNNLQKNRVNILFVFEKGIYTQDSV